MIFAETAPASTETTFHLHRDSDEVAYEPSDEISFKIGDELSVGGLPAAASQTPENHRVETGRLLFLYTLAGAGAPFEEQLGRPGQ
jgi:hypothetical protein